MRVQRSAQRIECAPDESGGAVLALGRKLPTRALVSTLKSRMPLYRELLVPATACVTLHFVAGHIATAPPVSERSDRLANAVVNARVHCAIGSSDSSEHAHRMRAHRDAAR